MKINIECPECDAVCNVKHDMDDELYIISFCPCCGCDIEEDDMYYAYYNE